MGVRRLWVTVRYRDPVPGDDRSRIEWARRVIELVAGAAAWFALVFGVGQLGLWFERGVWPALSAFLVAMLCMGIALPVGLLLLDRVVRLLRPSGPVLGVIVFVLFVAGFAALVGSLAAGPHVTGRTGRCQMLSAEPGPEGWHYRVRCPGEAAVLSVVRAERDDAVIARPLRYHPGRSKEAVPADTGGWLIPFWLGANGIVAASTALALLVGVVRVVRGRAGRDTDHEP